MHAAGGRCRRAKCRACRGPGALLAAQELHLGEVTADFLQFSQITIVLRSSAAGRYLVHPLLPKSINIYLWYGQATSIELPVLAPFLDALS